MSAEAINNIFEAASIELPPKLIVEDLASFLAKEIPPRELLLSPWLPKAGLCMIHAYRGIGKTHIALGIAYAIAQGGKFLSWEATKPLQAHATSEASKVGELKSCTVAITKGGNSATAIKRVRCDDCEHFLPDNIGDGAGIGTCKLGIGFTQEVRGRLALYRHAGRHCNLFRVSQK